MKKVALLILIVFTAGMFAPVAATSANDRDLQAIKKAVKDNPNYRKGDEVKWFRILVHDKKDNKDKVKITIPLAVVDVFMNCTKDSNLKIDCDDYDVDIRELFAELKKRGPMSLIEVDAEDEIVKIWFE